jgi:hypothetical protein
MGKLGVEHNGRTLGCDGVFGREEEIRRRLGRQIFG